MAITVEILQGGSNSHGVTVEDFNAFATDFLSEGVVGAITNTATVSPATGAFALNEQDTPDMTLACTAGVAYVTGTPTSGVSQMLRVVLDAAQNVTIAANATGGTRYDWVYIKLDADKMKDPAVGATDVATLVTSRSTSASTDNGTPPTFGYCIAVVTVANGASSILDASIADKRAEIIPVRDGSLKNTKLSTSAITLGYAEITSNFTSTTGGSFVDVTNLTVTVTVPAGGRRIKITGYAQVMTSTQDPGNGIDLGIQEGATLLTMASFTTAVAGYGFSFSPIASFVPTAGEHTYKITAKQVTNGKTLTLAASATSRAFILVELI